MQSLELDIFTCKFPPVGISIRAALSLSFSHPKLRYTTAGFTLERLHMQDPPSTNTPLNDDDELKPQPITALRMARFLIPLNDSAMDLADEKGRRKNRLAADSLLLWPPNLFAFTSEILSATGAYYLCVSPAKDESHHRKEVWPPKDYKPNAKDGDRWSDDVRKWGRAWRTRLNQKSKTYFKDVLTPTRDFQPDEMQQLLNASVPAEILECWAGFADGFDTDDLKNLLCLMDDAPTRSKHWKYFVALMTLHAVADEACLGWGIRSFVPRWGEEKTSDAQLFAEDRLARRGTLATVHEDRCRILPKRHTPNVGMTLRSVSSNLALYHRSSVEVRWRPAVPTPLTAKGDPITSLNVLLLPWPYRIWASDFKELEAVPYDAFSDRESFFQYTPDGERIKNKLRDEKKFLQDDLWAILEEAKVEAGRIDLVILPELAISEKNLAELENQLKEFHVSGYIAGVRQSVQPDQNNRGNRFDRNMVYCKFLRAKDGSGFEFPGKSEEEDYRQHKHHRWKLDRSQIVSYQLGGSLAPNKDWWEGIKLSRRRVSFFNVGNEVTICPLICEDLARQEPISDLIRAVGPTLVVAILMDGPQKMGRWSAGYASVLADDPRSSVLTFTCLGMVEKMQIPNVPKSRAVGLWKDPLHRPMEIELEQGKSAILLYMSVENQKEITADGRTEEVATPYLTLGGVSQIEI